MKAGRFTAVVLLAAVAGASAVRGEISFSLIDTGAPKVPSYVYESGYMPGYTGYILRVSNTSTAPQDYIGTVSFGEGPGSVAITGAFAQMWTSSTRKAISGKLGYDTFTPGLSLIANQTPDIWNMDSHFLGNPSLAITNVIENGTFLSGANVNPLEPDSTDYLGYGTGTRLVGTVGLVAAARATVVDIAYLVVPTGSSISFANAHVHTNRDDGHFRSWPAPSAHSAWDAPAGGSWAEASNWTLRTVVDGFQTEAGANVVPHLMGDTATIVMQAAAPSQIALDGNKAVSELAITTDKPLTIVQGSGGRLILDKGDVASAYIPWNWPASIRVGGEAVQISAPVQLNSDVVVSANGTRFEISGPISSGGPAKTGLVIRTETSLILSGDNTYTGSTYIEGTLQIGNGGTSGTLGKGAVSFSDPFDGHPNLRPGELLFNRSDTLIVDNPISGVGNVTQAGTGTLVLAGYNTFTGKTTTLRGTLVVQNPGPNSDSAHNVLAPLAAYSNWTTPEGKLANIGITASAGLKTQANLRAGAVTSPVAVTFSYRTRSGEEAAFLASEVFDLSGMAIAAGGRTDPFALELTYDEAALANESAAAKAGSLYLGWFDPQGKWVNAVAGNFEGGFTSVTNFQGSWGAFAGAFGVTDGNVGLYLGSWGVDTATNTVWAVLNHNSEFSVASAVPEPLSLAVLGPAAVLLLRRRRH